MATVRTRCPSCDVVTIDAPEVMVRRRLDLQGSEAIFVCPACNAVVSQAVEAHMVPVLIGAGCAVEDWQVSDARMLHPSSAGAITEAEIADFVAALDRRDWAEHLRL